MISICIPIYNFDVRPLIDQLHKQSQALNIASEIICIDDCSEKNFWDINERIKDKCSQYILLDNNIGRAKIRNLFLQYSRYDYLLFLDCDSLIIRNDFLQKYADNLSQPGNQVICGGRIYESDKPGLNKLLRWKYGIYKESQSVEVRMINPGKSFMTNNFLLYRSILINHSFDERLTEYGHEDTLFGYHLKKNSIAVQHIDNPVLNGEIEDNQNFLRKTELGLRNLVHILHFVDNDTILIQDVTLLKFYKKVEKYHLIPLVTIIYNVSRSVLKKMLVKGYVSLVVFDFYKLGYFATCMKQFAKKD